MRKLFTIFILCLIIISVPLYAQNESITDEPQWLNSDEEWRDKEAEWADEPFEEQEYPEEGHPEAPYSSLPIKDRTVEVGFAEIHIGFANNFIAASKIFQKTAYIDLDEAKNGLKLNVNAVGLPITFNYNSKNTWGFGIFTKVDAAGILDLSGETLNLQQVVNDKSTVGGSIFVEAGGSGFFTLKDFKIKIKPSIYYPIAFIDSDISYTLTEVDGNPKLLIDYEVDVWTAFPYETFMDDIELTANPGVDLCLGLEYPLAKVIGLSEKFKFLDFGLGLDFYNVPLVPAKLKDYMSIAGRFGSEEPIDILNLDFSALSDDMSTSKEYGTGEKFVLRPFKMLVWADWRPLGNKLLTIYPILGFSINQFYIQPFAMEAGIKARLDLWNFFITTVGIQYEDHLWRNSIDFALNFRGFEMDFGIDMRSQDFVKSWSGTGIGVFIAFKAGW